MGKFLNILGVTALGAGLLVLRNKNKEVLEEEERRKNTVCKFDDEILSQKEFENIVIQNCKRIKRINNITVNGPIINGTVRSQSGISSWEFTIDFNDYGKITGRYWIFSNNKDSVIPTAIANMVKEHIEEL